MKPIISFVTFMVFFWYCYDDALAAWLAKHYPQYADLGVGDVPVFLWFIVVLACSTAYSSAKGGK